MATARAIILPNRSVSRYAVAPGVTSIATTNTAPTVCSAATAVADSKVSNAKCSAVGLSPRARA